MAASYASEFHALPTGLEQPLEIPPAPKAPRFDLRRVVSLVRRFGDPEQQVDAGLEFFDAVGGSGGERTFQRFAAQPAGRRLLRTRPVLAELLGDREVLAALPEGSLGRAYFEFAQRNGFAADSLIARNREAHSKRPPSDEYRAWFWDRFTIAHDLWHVLTGCPTTEEGELSLLAFTFGQVPQRAYVLLLGLATLGIGIDSRALARQWRAWRAGCNAASLVAAPWEDYLAWPLDEVRRCFQIDVLEG